MPRTITGGPTREARPYLGFKRAQTKNTAMKAIKRVATVSGVFFSESISKTSGEVSAFHELIKLASADSCHCKPPRKVIYVPQKLVNILP
jgi:hypothetical protein